MGSEAICHFHARGIARRKKSTVSFTHVQNIICSQTQLDGIAHEQTIICRQLFAGHVVGSRSMKRKKNLLRMIILINNWVPKFPKQAEYKLFKIVIQGNVKRESERA